MPDIPGLVNGDYIDLEVCIDCGKVLGLPDAEDILQKQPVKTPRATSRRKTLREMQESLPECQVCGDVPGAGCPAC